MREKIQTTQADQLMKRWAGRNPDGSRTPGITPEMTGFKARMILAKSEPFKSNPEYAIGCARLLMTYNIMTHKDLAWMLANHPAWAQILDEGIVEPNGRLMVEANQSQWGQTHNVTATLEICGTAQVTYEGRKGVKTEYVDLGLEMIRYEGDTRPFIALNLGGGSAIKHFLLRTEPDRPDYEVNDDSNTRRWVSKRSSEEVKADELASVEKDLDALADSALAQLLAGENVTLGDLGVTTPGPSKSTQKSGRKGRAPPSANRKRWE